MLRDESAFAELFAKIERDRGFRGSLYRQKCLRRRVAVRMRSVGVTDPHDYCAVLDSDPREYDRLLRTLTINVSRFFRNPETWDVIRKAVYPDLFERPGARVFWSAGAAAGEEAYSLAILASEWLAASGLERRARRLRIIGTDIDADAISAARAGRYPAVALAEMTEAMKRRWFEAGDLYTLREPARSLVQFRQLDILQGRPDFDADLIVCRNLLIYFDRPAQEKVFETFIETLKPGGYMVLGRVETLPAEFRSRFEVVNGRERVYRKR